MKRLIKILQKLTVVVMLLGSFSFYEATNEPAITTVQAAKKRSKRKTHRTHTRRSKKLRVDRKRTTKKKQLKKRVQQNIPYGTVYIKISKSSPDYSAAVDAIKGWNATKVVRLYIVKKASSAYITMKDGNYGNTSWAGEEIASARSSEIRLNDYYLNFFNHQLKVDVAEHELGHSIGLGHISSVPSVMNPVLNPDQAYSIQPVDIMAVKYLYHEK